MSVYGQNSCTLSTITDVKAIYTYHCLISGTYNPGMAPNDNTSPLNSSDQVKDSIAITYNSNTYTWTLTEPGLDITNVDLNKLYYIDCVIFSNNTYDWGPALVSSSYEAAKQAYNKADVASGLVGNMNQHFWSLTSPYSTDIPAGQYITDDSQASFKGNPNGKSNLLLQSAGISLRYGAMTKAQVTSSGLKVIEGGIEGGSSSSGNGYVYLSTIDKNEITINDHTPGTNDPKWRAIIGSKFGVDSEGNLYASNAYIKGEIKADTGYIGGTSGWTIVSQQIYSTGKTIGADDSMFLSTKNLAGTVAGQTLTTTAPSWRLTVGSKFGVDNTGKLYASGATLKTVKLTDADDKERVIIDTNGLTVKDTSGNAVANFGTVASSTSTMTLGQVASGKYNIYLDNGGIKLRYNTTVLNLIDSTGMTLKNSSGTTLAEFKSYINLGTSHSNTQTGSAVIGVGLTTAKTNQVVVGSYNKSDSNATFIIGNGTGTAEADRSNLLEVGENAVTIGNSDASHTVLDSSGQRIYASNGTTKIAQLGYGQGSDASGYAIAPFYEFGTRKANTAPGNYSVLEGDDLIATGFASRVHGKCAEAKQALSNVSGLGVSDACGEIFYVDGNGEEVYEYENGGLISVIGTYNKPSDDSPLWMNYTIDESNSTTMMIRRNSYAFVIGNGTSDSYRSNALTVDWNGNIEAAGYTSHWCYVNKITSITITAQDTDKNIPITAVSSSSDSSVFERVADSNSKYGVRIKIPGTYMVSVSVGCNTATSGDLMGVTVFKNGVASLGPTYNRMGGNYDRIHLLPTPITIAAGDILTLYGRNNTDGRGTFDTCRLMIRKL